MDLALSLDNQQFIEQAVSSGVYPNETALLDVAVARLRDQEETLAAIREGLAQAERGEGMSLEEAREKLLRKYRVSESA